MIVRGIKGWVLQDHLGSRKGGDDGARVLRAGEGGGVAGSGGFESCQEQGGQD